MEEHHRAHALAMANELASRAVAPAAFRAALERVATWDRDAWLDVVLGLDAIPDDGPELPRGCVPYLPCPVAALLDAIDGAALREDDVFVDVGAGVGRAAAFVHLMTGATAIGVEIQPPFVAAARALARRLAGSRLESVEGDATNGREFVPEGTVYFLYCPFSGTRLDRLVDSLEERVRKNSRVRLCTVDVELPERHWLVRAATSTGAATIYSGDSGAR